MENKVSCLKKIEIIPDRGNEDRNEKHTHVIMILHGLGASGDDFVDFPNLIDLPKKNGKAEKIVCKFIFPHAQQIPVTINDNLTMPAWYDITNIDFERNYKAETVVHSIGLLKDIINGEIASGIEPDNIIVGGFSQGGAMAFELVKNIFNSGGITLGGIFILSSYILDIDNLALPDSTPSLAFKKIPIFMAHGLYDQVVPFKLGHKHKELLRKEKFQIDWKEYPIEHSLSNQEISDLTKWIDKLWKK